MRHEIRGFQRFLGAAHVLFGFWQRFGARRPVQMSLLTRGFNQDVIYPAVGLLATQLTEQAVAMPRIKLITVQDNYGRQ